MTSDRLNRFQTIAAVLLVAAIAAVVSYVHIEHLARTHGQILLAAVLIPLSIDGTVAAMSGVMLSAARSQLPTPPLARFMLALAVLATLLANIASGIASGWLAALIAGWPAVAFVGCVEVSILWVRRSKGASAEGQHQPSLPPAAETVTLEAQEQLQLGAPALGNEEQPGPLPEARPAAAVNGAQKRGATATARPRRSAGPRSVFAAELDAGVLPSKRDIQKRMHVGWDKVDAIRADLEQAISERMAMAGNGNGVRHG